MVAASGQPLAELRVDGGASVMDLLMQIQADQLGVRVVRGATAETTAVGAAYLAGLAEGVWDLDAVGILPSTAVGFLLQTAKRLHGAGGRMALACGQARVLATLRTIHRHLEPGGTLKGWVFDPKTGSPVPDAMVLVEHDEELRGALREKGMLTRDPRQVERKKPGRPKARKRFQFSKR